MGVWVSLIEGIVVVWVEVVGVVGLDVGLFYDEKKLLFVVVVFVGDVSGVSLRLLM